MAGRRGRAVQDAGKRRLTKGSGTTLPLKTGTKGNVASAHVSDAGGIQVLKHPFNQLPPMLYDVCLVEEHLHK